MQNYMDELFQLMKSDLPDEQIAEQLENYHEKDIATVLEMLDQQRRVRLYHILGKERVSEVFTYLSDVGKYLKELPIENDAAIVAGMDADDAVDVLETLDPEVRRQIVAQLPTEERDDIRLICSYDEDEIGSQMTTNYVNINRHLTIKQAMRALIAQAEENDNIGTLYISDDDGSFYGAVDLKDLIIARESSSLEDIISQSYPTVGVHEHISECIERLKGYAEDSIPVLNEKKHLIGVITAQDIVEVVDDEMGDDYAKLAGLSCEADLNEKLSTSMKKRIPWLIVLLFMGMLVSSVVGFFEPVVAQLAVVVCFQSLILDMAGNVGTQSLAVTIRVLMDEQVTARQKLSLVLKEMKIGLCNGLLLGSLSFIAIGLYLWLFRGTTPYYSFCVAGCVTVALILAMVISSLSGTTIPMLFHKLKIDPAVASGPLITTIDDLVAVVTYYGLAWIFLIDVLHLAG